MVINLSKTQNLVKEHIKNGNMAAGLKVLSDFIDSNDIDNQFLSDSIILVSSEYQSLSNGKIQGIIHYTAQKKDCLLYIVRQHEN